MYSCEVQRWFLLFFSFLRLRFELCERSVTFHSRTDGFGVTCQWFCNNRPQNPKTQMLTLAFPQPHRHGLMSAALLCSHWQSGRGLHRLAALLSTSSSQKVVDSSPHRCNLFSKLSFLVAGRGNVIYFCFSFLTSPQQAPKELKQTLRLGSSQCWWCYMRPSASWRRFMSPCYPWGCNPSGPEFCDYSPFIS